MSVTDTGSAESTDVEVTLRVPAALHARYAALVGSRCYLDYDEAVREAMRSHLRSDIDATHYLRRLRSRDPGTGTRERGVPGWTDVRGIFKAS